MERAMGIGGIEDAQERLSRAGEGRLGGGRPEAPFLGEQVGGPRVPQKQEQQAQDKKAGGDELPRASAGTLSAFCVHRDKPRIPTTR